MAIRAKQLLQRAVGARQIRNMIGVEHAGSVAGGHLHEVVDGSGQCTGLAAPLGPGPSLRSVGKFGRPLMAATLKTNDFSARTEGFQPKTWGTAHHRARASATDACRHRRADDGALGRVLQLLGRSGAVVGPTFLGAAHRFRQGRSAVLVDAARLEHVLGQIGTEPRTATDMSASPHPYRRLPDSAGETRPSIKRW
jgi:hypothetical protein